MKGFGGLLIFIALVVGCSSSSKPSSSASLVAQGGGEAEATIIGTWKATRNDGKPDQVGEVCTFATDHTMTCSEPSGVAVPVATWQVTGDNVTLQAGGVGITTKVVVTGTTLTFTDAGGHVTGYERV